MAALMNGSLTVLPEEPILDTLKSYLQVKGYPMGFTEKRNVTEESYVEKLETQSSVLSTENVFKMGALRNKTTGAFEWEQADKFVAKCIAQGKQMHMHAAFVWFNDIPKLLSDQENHPDAYNIFKNYLDNHVTTVITRYKGKFKSCDVINEEVNDRGEEVDSAWSRVLGDDRYEIAFGAANRADPNLLLTYNDWGLETGNMNRTNKLLAIKNRLAAKGIPIHVVAFQMHTFLGLDIDTARTRFRFWVQNGMKVMITELDVKTYKAGRAPIKYGLEYVPEMEFELGVTYVDILDALEKGAGLANIVAVIMWSISDKAGENFENLKGLIHHLMLFDQYREPKKAYYDVMARLLVKPDNSEIFQDFELGEISSAVFIGSKTGGTKPATWKMMSRDAAARARVNFQGLGMAQTQVNVPNIVYVEASTPNFHLSTRVGFVYNNKARELHLAFRIVDENNMYSLQAKKTDTSDIWQLIKRKNGQDIVLLTTTLLPLWGDYLDIYADGNKITFAILNIQGHRAGGTIIDADFNTSKNVGLRLKGHFNADKYSTVKFLKCNPI